MLCGTLAFARQKPANRERGAGGVDIGGFFFNRWPGAHPDNPNHREQDMRHRNEQKEGRRAIGCQ